MSHSQGPVVVSSKSLMYNIYSKDRQKAVRACVRTYRQMIDQFAQMDYLDMWYDHLDVEHTLDQFESAAHDLARRVVVRVLAQHMPAVLVQRIAV